MWGGIVGLIIQLIAGGVGGNVAGSVLKQYDLGTIGNTIAGIGRRRSGGRRSSERWSVAEPRQAASISAPSSVRLHPAGSAAVS